MFYGRLNDPGNSAFFQEALARFKQIFASVYASDNVILFNRTMGFKSELLPICTRNARNVQERSLLLRLNTLAWAASQALHVPGDFVECGVWRGFCSAVVADFVKFETVDKSFFLYDTFEGIPPEYDSEKHDSPAFREAGLFESVRERFARFPNVRLIRGLVPESFDQALPERIAFLHLDMNSSKSEIAALDTLFDRVSPGGLIVFDDYGWTGYQAQQHAEDEFMRQRGYRILELPTGQGLLVKHCSA